ncbi:MAG: LuxR C-terminal-related transcriptional regulator [Myxococcota bacterium]|jgi:DNA-binding CsgD family transcriptional regulator
MAIARALSIDPRRSIDVIEHRLGSTFHSLTGRERAVCARTMVGMTAEAIGLDLGISPASVLTYRRRAYERYCFTHANQFFLGLI